jgi:hypothetical protein
MPSMLPAAIAGSAGLNLLGSSMQAGAAKSAANTQLAAAQQAAQLQWQMFQQMQGNLQPYMATGVNALNSLAMLTGVSGSNDAQIRSLQQQIAALTGGGAGTGAAAGGNYLTAGETPGVIAAKAAGPHSQSGLNFLSPAGLFRSNASPLQDIAAALAAGQPISDASWAKAGYGPGGAAKGQVAGPGGSSLTPEVAAQVQALQKQISDLQGSNQPGNPLTAPLTKPFNPTQQQLEQTPGYQFTLSQGLRATQNAATAMGLGASGSALGGAADYATGLASQTYQQQFSNYWQQNQNIYNMLAGLTNIGQSSAAGVGAAGIQTGGLIGNALTGGASALAAGQIGSANAIASGLGGVGNAGLMLALSRNGLFGNTGVARSTIPSTGAAGYGVTDDYGNLVE